MASDGNITIFMLSVKQDEGISDPGSGPVCFLTCLEHTILCLFGPFSCSLEGDYRVFLNIAISFLRFFEDVVKNHKRNSGLLATVLLL